jgi:hypothetical protein
LRSNIKTEMGKLMPALHELSDKELREKLPGWKLSHKKATIARALLEGVAKSVFRHGSSGTLGSKRYSPQLD